MTIPPEFHIAWPKTILTKPRTVWTVVVTAVLVIVIAVSGQWTLILALVVVPLLSGAVQEIARPVFGCRTCET